MYIRGFQIQTLKFEKPPGDDIKQEIPTDHLVRKASKW
jgi:hypothetical protein